MQKYCTPKICPLPTRLILKDGKVRERYEDIIDYAARFYGQPWEDIKSRTRKRPVTEARFIIMYLLRAYTRLGVVAVGNIFERDYTSVIHAVKTVNNLLETDPNFAANYMALVELLKENNVIK